MPFVSKVRPGDVVRIGAPVGTHLVLDPETRPTSPRRGQHRARAVPRDLDDIVEHRRRAGRAPGPRRPRGPVRVEPLCRTAALGPGHRRVVPLHPGRERRPDVPGAARARRRVAATLGYDGRYRAMVCGSPAWSTTRVQPSSPHRNHPRPSRSRSTPMPPSSTTTHHARVRITRRPSERHAPGRGRRRPTRTTTTERRRLGSGPTRTSACAPSSCSPARSAPPTRPSPRRSPSPGPRGDRAGAVPGHPPARQRGGPLHGGRCAGPEAESRRTRERAGGAPPAAPAAGGSPSAARGPAARLRPYLCLGCALAARGPSWAPSTTSSTSSPGWRSPVASRFRRRPPGEHGGPRGRCGGAGRARRRRAVGRGRPAGRTRQPRATTTTTSATTRTSITRGLTAASRIGGGAGPPFVDGRSGVGRRGGPTSGSWALEHAARAPLPRRGRDA